MAELTKIACPGCGSLREPAAFGLVLDGDNVEVLEDQPRHELAVMINTIGGRGRCRWDRLPIPRVVARALLRRLREAAQRLDELLDERSGDDAAA